MKNEDVAEIRAKALEMSKEYFGGDELAADVFVNKYALRDNTDKLLEMTPDDMHRRLAEEFARIEAKYPNPMSFDEIYAMLKNFEKIVPQGSPMSAIGNKYKLQSSSNCFVGETEVCTVNRGVQKISEVQIGDVVVTHTGDLRKVSQLHKNPLAGRQLYEIKAYRTPAITVTGNHKLLSLTKEQELWGEKPQWNSVEHLRTGDFIAIPKGKLSYDPQILNLAKVFNPNRIAVKNKTYLLEECDNSVILVTQFTTTSGTVTSRTHRPVNKSWKIDAKFARFIGLWLGDGCIFAQSKEDNTLRGISFTFSYKETDQIEFVSSYGEELFGIRADINTNNAHVDSTVQIIFNSTFVAACMQELFGRGCSGKKLPDMVYSWSKPMVEELLSGLISSDGTVTDTGDVRVVMKNKKLIKAIYHLARQHSIVVGYSDTSEDQLKKGTARIDFPKRSSLIKNISKVYDDDRIANALEKGESKLFSKEVDDLVLVKLTGKSKSNRKDEFVYTIGVEGIHSYNVEGLICENCFVITPPTDSYAGILHTDQQEAQIMKRRGGVGFDISNIRPKGLVTQNAAGTTDGIGIFMDRFSNTCREVAQGGRRGALMLSISCHHPEVMTFINIKRDKKRVTGANISVRWTDEFLKAVENKGKAELRFPVDKDAQHLVKKEVDAKEIWDAFVEAAWDSAEPGCLFWDTALERTPSDCYADEGFRSTSTNPCLAGDTLIAVADGRNAVSIKQLAEEGKDVPVYSCDSNGKVIIKTMRNPRLTGHKKEVFKVTLDDGSSFRATENHKILLSDGSFVEIKDLKGGDSLNIMRKKESTIKEIYPTAGTNSQKYYWIYSQNIKTPTLEHRMIWEYYNNEKISHKYVIHHKDYNARNNAITNLQCMSKQDHHHLHSKDMIGDKNPIFKIKADPEKFEAYRKKMSEATSGIKNGNYKYVSNEMIKNHAIILTEQLGRRFSHLEWISYASENCLPQTFSAYRGAELTNVITLAKWAAAKLGIEHADEDPRLVRTLNNALESGYEAFISNHNGVREVFVHKSCEECGSQFSTKYFQREASFCSTTCSNIYLNKNTDVNLRRADSINSTYAEKASGIRNKQLQAFTALKFQLGRIPLMKEWEQECKSNNISFRLKTKHGFKSWKDVVDAGINFNHRVASVILDGVEDVYNGTVDDTHNFYFGCFESIDAKGSKSWTSINNRQCGEIILSNNDSCRLLVLNTLGYVKNPFKKNASFDFDTFKADTMKAQRLMDDIIDLEIEAVDKIIAKVKSDPEPDDVKLIELNLWENVREAAVKGRRTGLGVTAIGDTLAALGIKYGSPASIKETEKIYKALALSAYRSSVNLAKERGAFPIFNAKKEKGHPFMEQILDADDDLRKMHAKYGRRNIALTTTAPTGSVSIMTQTTSGIEPVFLTHYKRRRKINPDDKTAKVDFVDAIGDSWQEYTVYHPGVKKWMDITGETNLEKSPYFGATANDVDWEASVDLQAAAQKWICHAISKTCNIPNSATKGLVDRIYMRAWKKGCKGFTVYRDGCRSGVLVSTETEKKAQSVEGRPDTIVASHAPKRPDSLACEIHQATIKGKKWVILVSLLENIPYEIFAGLAEQLELPAKYKMGKVVKIKQGHYNLHCGEGEEELVVRNIVKVFDNPESAWATRMISMSMRHGVEIAFIVEQLSKDGGINDVNKVLARVLKKYIPDGSKVKTSQSCPQCNSKDLVYAEGCLSCKSCGYSKC